MFDEHPERDDPRLLFPATERNRGPLAEALRRWLPDAGVVLEVASGSGEHLTHFAHTALAPGVTWQPSDPDDEHLASIDAWTAHLGVGDRVAPALRLDATATPETWPLERAAAILCCNMIHIAPWEACLGLLGGAARLLAPGARLILYGPFMRGGVHTAPSNEAFDARLRERDARWGVRDLDVVTEEASARGLSRVHVEAMPANNLTVVFERRDADDAPATP